LQKGVNFDTLFLLEETNLHGDTAVTMFVLVVGFLATMLSNRFNISTLRNEVKNEIKTLRDDINKNVSTLRDDASKNVSTLRDEIKTEIETLRGEMRKEFSDVKNLIQHLIDLHIAHAERIAKLEERTK
jgi:ElaB/YqjD/DUF883 family membrane-anchored ribosome-binding protein